MPNRAPIKFLLVDDLDANLLALEGLLRRDNLEILKARSGVEALELLLVHEVALALIDVQMPGLNGFELADLMRGTANTRAVPIIFLTAGSIDPQRRIRGFETGAIDFLPKPVDPEMLLNKAAVFYELALQRQELKASEERLVAINGELENAVRSRDKFLAMLAHELRNPLAPLLMGAEMLMSNRDDAALSDRLLSMMSRQIGQMAHLIDDLLDVSRITTGKIELRTGPVRIAETISQAVESVQPLLAEFNHTLTVEDFPQDLEVVADPHRLTQILSNLLSNACKYTPPGGRIITTVSTTPEDRVRIAVSDNGRGVPLEMQARIFDIFEQGENGSRDGLGLGLTLVKSLAELHGGSVTMKSGGEGLGSEFAVEIPGVVHGETGGSPEPAPREVPAALRILIADDGRMAADTLRTFFECEGMETAVAYDGKQAVAAAETFHPDLACLDLGMPEMNGYEAASRIRELFPDAYIVALSGWGGAEVGQRVSEAGFDEHLVKPVGARALRDLLARVGGR